MVVNVNICFADTFRSGLDAQVFASGPQAMKFFKGVFMAAVAQPHIMIAGNEKDLGEPGAQHLKSCCQQRLIVADITGEQQYIGGIVKPRQGLNPVHVFHVVDMQI